MLKKLEVFDGKISVITAVYNAEDCIQHLIESLRKQNDQNFEWVVVDGLSTDSTLEILKEIDDLNIKIISEADFGIYDALNKGIKACTGEYYLVAGADDIFFQNAIKDYKAAIEDGVNMVTATIIKNGNEVKAGNGPAWQFGQGAFISNHAIGVLIKKNLHEIYGFYSRKFPISADQLFIQQCALGGIYFRKIDAIIGEFFLEGISSTDHIGALTEFFRIQILLSRNKWIQYIIYILRIFKQLKKN